MAGPSALPNTSGAAEKAPVPRLQVLDIMAQVLTEQLQKILAESLDLRIQSLPQELRDHILNFTIAVEPNEDGVVEIDEFYKPPLGLQLNRKIRAAFAEQYYGGDTVFRYLFPHNPASHGEIRWVALPRLRTDASKTLMRWIASLQSQHRLLIATIRLDWQCSLKQRVWPKWWKYWIRYQAEYLASYDHLGSSLNQNVFVFGLQFDEFLEWYRPNTKVNSQKHCEIAMRCTQYASGTPQVFDRYGLWVPQ